MTGERYMRRAAELAREAAAAGEVPVGAVVVRKSDGLIVGEGRNRREELRCPTAHAELEAINNASRFLGGWRLCGCEMYVTLEPCPMCAGGIVNARIDKVIFGAYDDKSGCCGSAASLTELPYNHHVKVCGGFMEAECAELLKDFFKNKRRIKMDIKLVEAKTDDQLKRVAGIADSIWHEYFPCILTEGQIDYMVEKFCSFEAMKENIASERYIYYIIKKGADDIGYTAIKPDGDRLFLSKIYIRREDRGKKYARAVMEMHKDFARNGGMRAIWLTVNKYNENSIAAYKKMGFEVIGDGVADIGSGYVMDDYFMECIV